jgi:hypothetical protein
VKIAPQIPTKLKTKNATRGSRQLFQRRRAGHDPLLVFNMSIFNFGGGWQEIVNPLKARETVG